MDIKVTIPDKHEVRVLKGFCYHHGYPDVVADADGNPIPNPETRRQFAKRKLAQIIMAGFSAWEAEEAARIARDEALENANTIIVQ